MMVCLGEHKTYLEYIDARDNPTPKSPKTPEQIKDSFKKRAERQKRKWGEGKKTGILFGKPIIQVFYERYKKGAEKRLIPFELTYEDFRWFWQEKCHYCHSKIETVGLDRKDNYEGYTKENVVPCCTQCNLMKRSMPYEDYIKHCKKVANQWKTIKIKYKTTV